MLETLHFLGTTKDPEIVHSFLFVFISWALPYLFPRAPGPVFNYARVSFSVGKYLIPSVNHSRFNISVFSIKKGIELYRNKFLIVVK